MGPPFWDSGCPRNEDELLVSIPFGLYLFLPLFFCIMHLAKFLAFFAAIWPCYGRKREEEEEFKEDIFSFLFKEANGLGDPLQAIVIPFVCSFCTRNGGSLPCTVIVALVSTVPTAILKAGEVGRKSRYRLYQGIKYFRAQRVVAS